MSVMFTLSVLCPHSIYAVARPANQAATLTQSVTNWVLVFKNGERRTFDINTGNLVSIADRNGNATQLTYDNYNRLTTVTDAASRHLNVSYASSSRNLITGISTDAGPAVLIPGSNDRITS